MSIPLAALALVVASAFCWSGFDVVRKVLVHRMPPMPLLFLLVLGQIPFFGAWWLVQPGEPVSAAYWGPAVGTVVLNVVANVAFILAIHLSPLFVTIPLLSLVPAFTALLAMPLLGELPGPWQWLGILAVVAGALLLNLSDRPPGVSWLRALLEEKGALLMLVVAFSWALALPLDKLAMRAAGPAFHGLVLAVGVSVGVGAVLVARGEAAELGKAWRAPWLIPLAVVVSALALAFQLLAIQVVWVSLVETLKRGIGNFMALVWGRFLLGEEVTRWSVVAVALMAAGVTLIL